MKLQILIVENEQDDIDSLRRYLETNHSNDVVISAIAKSYEEALSILAKDITYDLSILDIKLSETRTSFELITAFEKEKFGTVAFLTELINIPTEILEKVQPITFTKPFNDAKIANLIYKVNKNRNIHTVVEIPKVGKEISFKTFKTVEEIYYVSSVENEPKHSIFHFFDKKKNRPDLFESTMSIADFEKIPKEDVFTKCNRNCLVNVTHIDDLDITNSAIKFDEDSFQDINYSHVFYQSLKRKIKENK